MSDVPQISAQQLIKALKKIGFEVSRQKGSHIRLARIYKNKKQLNTIPNHKVIRKGTLLQGILKPINLTVEDLKKLLT
ncbi:MAG: type II toxin-antitoxin system HicA family toxin [Candidatus Daviesbacteria bacterium]|nr:type II toxin-antitoxin system HicA family toxin [Candidatus Daviesbacteria bacterium]